MAIVLLSACGGGGTPVVTYVASATAGSNGTVSPATATVAADGTAQFTVTPSSGYGISGVTGCGGTLTGNTYTTGAVNANCTVTASFVIQYSVTATSGSQGSISPASAMVNAGGTTTFNTAPDKGYAASVSGCGGTLSGNSYTTGAISADCAVTASFAAAFTWIGGPNIANGKGSYGTQGVAAATNIPGPRDEAATWTDSGGNLWLFGGEGDDATGSWGQLNDLWKYSPSSGEWTWIAGSKIGDAPGLYGAQAIASAANLPGARDSSLVWTAGGQVWLFGGGGYDSTDTLGDLGDLWTYPTQ